jgi:hypothetical protein
MKAKQRKELQGLDKETLIKVIDIRQKTITRLYILIWSMIAFLVIILLFLIAYS